jgi:cyclopropane-fatty-acyl-phospholipid synthase
MFEHLKNYELLFKNIARWLRPGGLLFTHIFTHQRFSYHFVSTGPSDWMSRYFFTGGQMPAHDLLPRFNADLTLVQDWQVNGRHYQQTAEHWLHGPEQATKWWAYWRVFYLSCAELWGYRGGEEWLVSHYLFRKA